MWYMMMVLIHDIQGDLSIYHQLICIIITTCNIITLCFDIITRINITAFYNIASLSMITCIIVTPIYRLRLTYYCNFFIHVSSRYDIITSYIIIAVCLNDHHHISVFSNYHITAYMTLTWINIITLSLSLHASHVFSSLHLS